MKTTSLFIPLFTAAFVSAHGHLSTLTINGKAYEGNPPIEGIPQASTIPSVIRQVNTSSPVYNATNPFLPCGINATPAAKVADANPGDIVTFEWKGEGGNNWPHNTGPMLTYMANCGDVSCDQFDTSQAKWFKIDQQGKTNSSTSGGWAQAILMAGGAATVTIPHTLAPGNYILRHEIIALQLVALYKAEFYPNCAQLRVGGSQNGAPTPDELVTFPGAYHDTDPGIFDPTVYDPDSPPYVFPGPAIASFVGAPASGTPPSSSGNSSTPSTSDTPSNCSTASGASYNIKRASRKRHLSRVMQRLRLSHLKK